MILISYFLLVLVCVCAIAGLFIFKDYQKKIASLSVSYSSIIILLSLIAYQNNLLDKILSFFISLILIFSINLMIAIGIIKNIGETNLNKKQLIEK